MTRKHPAYGRKENGSWNDEKTVWHGYYRVTGCWPVGAVTNNGFLVYLLYPDSAGTDGTLLLDVHPSSPYDANRGIKINGNADMFADAMLNIGETFTWRGISITANGTSTLATMGVPISR